MMKKPIYIILLIKSKAKALFLAIAKSVPKSTDAKIHLIN